MHMTVVPNYVNMNTWLSVHDCVRATGAVHMSELRKNLRSSTVENTVVMHEYDIVGSELAFRGYAVRASMEMIEAIRAQPEVDYVELNQEVHAIQEPCQRQDEATWVRHPVGHSNTAMHSHLCNIQQSCCSCHLHIVTSDITYVDRLKCVVHHRLSHNMFFLFGFYFTISENCELFLLIMCIFNTH